MRRNDMYQRLNRNSNSLVNHSSGLSANNMSPNMFVDHVWLPDDGISTGVQIIELNSDSDSDATIVDDKDYRCNWSYAKTTDDIHKVNEAARERRRLKNQLDSTTNNAESKTSQYDDSFPYRDVYLGSTSMQDDIYYNHQMNCFTILDKHLESSDSSDDDFNDMINCGGTEDAWTYDDGDITYTNPSADNEKRTVWIYSFKNKRLLSDNTFELVNIPSQDEGNNTVEFPERAESNRVASPIPNLHIPRLHIPTTPTLPTVTEISEPERPEANQTLRKPNNWFLSEHVTPTSETVVITDKSKSIVNWMALSPREKRRRFRNVSPIAISKELISPLQTVKELVEYNDENDKCCEVNPELLKESFMEEQLQDSSIHSRKSLIGNALGTARKSIRTLRSRLSTPIPTDNNMNTTQDPPTVISDTEHQDRGDHEKRSFKPPHIKISPSVVRKPITDPMEKLDSEEWIHEEKLIDKNTDNGISVPKDSRGDIASEALWMRNMALLKPGLWAEYLPITESIPSLHLTMNTDSDVEHRPWYRRIAYYFKCCK